jgi:hypothetical protein
MPGPERDGSSRAGSVGDHGVPIFVASHDENCQHTRYERDAIRVPVSRLNRWIRCLVTLRNCHRPLFAIATGELSANGCKSPTPADATQM